MKNYTLAFIVCALLGCTAEHASPIADNRMPPAEDTPIAIAPEDDAGVPPDAMVKEMEVQMEMDAGMPVVEKPVEKKKKRKPKPVADAGMPDARVEMDAQVPDSGSHRDGGQPTVDAGPSHGGSLRNLTVHLTGMDDDLHHFAQFRLVNDAREFHIMFVIHEGLTSADYTWALPNALFTDESYTMDFFIDHSELTGPGFFDKPPIDHAWSIAIPAGDGDVTIEFPFNTDFTDIEDIAPLPFHSTILASTGMSEYIGALYDVRVIDLSSGRLVGRQVREIPGDTFDLTVGSTTHEGVMYEVDVAVDSNSDGDYDHEPSWRLTGTGSATGLHLSLDSSAPQVDVGF